MAQNAHLVHEADEAINRIFHIAERPRLRAVAVDGDVLTKRPGYFSRITSTPQDTSLKGPYSISNSKGSWAVLAGSATIRAGCVFASCSDAAASQNPKPRTALELCNLKSHTVPGPAHLPLFSVLQHFFGGM